MTLTQINPAMRLVFSGAIVFAVLAAVAGVSGALLTSNPATATANTMATGNAELLIAHEDETTVSPQPLGPYGTTITDAFNADGMVPGEMREFHFWLKNDSEAAISLNLFADLSNFEFVGDSGTNTTGAGTDLEDEMEIGFTCDNVANGDDGSTASKTLLGSGGNWTNSTTTGKEQFNATGSAILGASDATDGSGADEARCTMTVILSTDSTSADDSATFDAVFTGEQAGAPTT